MKSRLLPSTLGSLLFLFLSGCLPRQESGYAPEEETMGENYPADATPETTDCQAWCDLRAPLEADSGWCPIDDRFGEDSQGCVEECSVLKETTPHQLLQKCIEEDALCFVMMQDCLAHQDRLDQCETHCEYRESEHAAEGFCDPAIGNLPERDCLNVCVYGLAQDLPRKRVAECIRNSPLCFQDLNSCVM